MQNSEDSKIELIETKDNYQINPIGLFSLKRALISYFSTYEGIMRNITIRNSDDELNAYPSSYFEYYIDCIILFHHFFELTIKDLLAHDSELLIITYKNSKSIEPLYNLIHKKNTNTDKLNTVEFSEALQRIKILADKIYSDGKFNFIANTQNYESLNKLNNYRNMVLHRGRTILKFTELDCFIGKNILPIIQEIFEHRYYEGLEKKWKYPPLHCKIDPIEEIINEFKSPNPNFKKIALLKEMGRASYKQPQNSKAWGKILEKHKKSVQDKILAMAHFESSMPKELLPDYMDTCPVCGKTSIITFEDSYYDYDETDELINNYQEWIASIKCVWCSYELDCAYIGDISNFGLAGLKNYFKNNN